MKKTKKIRGSAYTEEDGTFHFSPYNNRSEEEKNLELIRKSTYSTLWLGAKKVSVRLSFTRKSIPPYNVWVEQMTEMYNAMLFEINNKKL